MLKKTVLTLAATLALSGCLANAPQKPVVPEDSILEKFISRNVTTGAVAGIPETKPFNYLQMTPSVVYLKNKLPEGPSIQEDNLRRERLSSTILEEPTAQLYIQAAKARGSIVKVYRPEFAAKALKLLSPHSDFEGRRVTYDATNLLVEYSTTGRPLSYIGRVNLVGTGPLGSLHNIYFVIAAGSKIGQNLENSFPRSVFTENYLRDL